MPCEDAPCCGCCDPQNDYVSPELAVEIAEDEMEQEPWDGFQTDAEADGDALASAGHGTDEDYCLFDEMACEGYDEY